MVVLFDLLPGCLPWLFQESARNQAVDQPCVQLLAQISNFLTTCLEKERSECETRNVSVPDFVISHSIQVSGKLCRKHIILFDLSAFSLE